MRKWKTLKNNQEKYSPIIEKLEKPFIMYSHWVITLHKAEIRETFTMSEAEAKFWKENCERAKRWCRDAKRVYL